MSAAALVGSVLWILICTYEVWGRENTTFAGGPGEFLKVEAVVQLSALGVVGLAALAWLAEQIWPPARY